MCRRQRENSLLVCGFFCSRIKTLYRGNRVPKRKKAPKRKLTAVEAVIILAIMRSFYPFSASKTADIRRRAPVTYSAIPV